MNKPADCDNKPTQRVKDISGMIFGRLTAVAFAGRNDRGEQLWRCRCECGATPVVLRVSMMMGLTRSCGCLYRESRTKHGHSKHGGYRTPELQAFYDAKKRCMNPNNPRYAEYGGRGIEFRFTEFSEMFDEIGPRPSADHSLDRIDNDGHYERGNIRWATREQQQHNRRDNRM